jgi:hypothetical protein
MGLRRFPSSSRLHSIGVSVSETKAEAMMAATRVMPNSRK